MAKQLTGRRLRQDLEHELRALKNAERAEASQWFFKTGPGQYGAGDQFFGITVPVQRKIAKRYQVVSLSDIQKLLASPIHEFRLVAVFILVYQFEKADTAIQKQIYQFYLRQAKRINNWDLVDSSAPYILGEFLLDKPRKQLYTLAKSKNLWEKRIAILATQTFIRHQQFTDTLAIAKLLLRDEHDLIHKAVGWMLREVGNRDQPTEERFLKQHTWHMPRTMLRYAIEKFSKTKRQYYLALKT